MPFFHNYHHPGLKKATTGMTQAGDRPVEHVAVKEHKVKDIGATINDMAGHGVSGG